MQDIQFILAFVVAIGLMVTSILVSYARYLDTSSRAERRENAEETRQLFDTLKSDMANGPALLLNDKTPFIVAGRDPSRSAVVRQGLAVFMEEAQAQIAVERTVTFGKLRAKLESEESEGSSAPTPTREAGE